MAIFPPDHAHFTVDEPVVAAARITAVADYKVELPFTPVERFRCDRGHTWTGPSLFNLRGAHGEPRCATCFREWVSRTCGLVERECGRVTPMV